MTAPTSTPPSDRELVEFFLQAYRHGAFPMAEPENRRLGSRVKSRARRIDWYIPDPRAVIELHAPPRAPQDLGGFHMPRSLAKRLRNNPFEVTSDAAFADVIRACAEPAPELGREDSWLDERLIDAYIALHRAGHAHSIEVWRKADLSKQNTNEHVLVGGIYGLALGAAFCAESMFCRPELGGTDASKIALAYLVRHLRDQGYVLLDVQIRNHHTDQFGVIDIPADNYLERLTEAIRNPMEFGVVRASWAPGR